MKLVPSLIIFVGILTVYIFGGEDKLTDILLILSVGTIAIDIRLTQIQDKL